MRAATTDWKLALRQLKQFQDYTLKIHDLDAQLATITERREHAQHQLVTLQGELAAKTSEKEGIEHSRRQDEQEVEVDKVHLQDRETKLYAIKTNKEYQAALKEVADAKRVIKEREDRVIGEMEILEKLAQEIAQLSATVADTETATAALAATLASEEAACRAERDRECAARETIAGMIAPEAMKIYRDVQRRFADALAAVEQGVCGGCNMRVPPQRFVEVQQHRRLYDCPSCHRILYVAEVEKN